MTDWQMGLLAFREGRMREAADKLSLALSEQELSVSLTSRFETCSNLGAALYAEGRHVDAVAAFETAFRLSPTPIPPVELTLNLVHAYLAAQRRDAAHEALLFLLSHAPGHVAARMLLQRLDHVPQNRPVAGSIMGDSIDSARKYLQTVNFTRVASGGYDTVEVQEVLSLVEKYIIQLDLRLQSSQNTVLQYEDEIERYRQAEDAMVQNIVQMQQDSQQYPQNPDLSQLTPIEILFQKRV